MSEEIDKAADEYVNKNWVNKESVTYSMTKAFLAGAAYERARIMREAEERKEAMWEENDNDPDGKMHKVDWVRLSDLREIIEDE